MLFGDKYEQLYFLLPENEAKGDELSGITGARLVTSSLVKRMIKANGVHRRL